MNNEGKMNRAFSPKKMKIMVIVFLATCLIACIDDSWSMYQSFGLEPSMEADPSIKVLFVLLYNAVVQGVYLYIYGACMVLMYRMMEVDVRRKFIAKRALFYVVVISVLWLLYLFFSYMDSLWMTSYYSGENMLSWEAPVMLFLGVLSLLCAAFILKATHWQVRWSSWLTWSALILLCYPAIEYIWSYRLWVWLNDWQEAHDKSLGLGFYLLLVWIDCLIWAATGTYFLIKGNERLRQSDESSSGALLF